MVAKRILNSGRPACNLKGVQNGNDRYGSGCAREPTSKFSVEPQFTKFFIPFGDSLSNWWQVLWKGPPQFTPQSVKAQWWLVYYSYEAFHRDRIPRMAHHPEG